MSRTYCPRLLFRSIAPELWNEFFLHFGVVFRNANDGDAVEHHLRQITEPRRAEARLALRQVFAIGTNDGLLALWDAKRAAHPDVRIVVKRLENPHTVAMRAWLETPALFQEAIRHLRWSPRPWWTRCAGLPRQEARVDDDSLRSLATEISALLAAEGRGHRCTVEHHFDSLGTQYYVCRPDDHPCSLSSHAPTGELVTRTLLPTFEIAYAFHPATGVLETSVSARGKLKRGLQEAFAGSLLDCSIPEQTKTSQFDLTGLRDRRFVLETDPADAVRAKISAISVLLPDRKRLVVLDSLKLPFGPSIWEMAEECLHQENLRPSQLNVVAATFQFEFLGKNRGRSPHLQFDVEAPDRCTLRSEVPERVTAIYKHFEMWEVCRAA